MKRVVKFQVILNNKKVGVERLGISGWEWTYFDLSPDSGKQWVPGFYGNGDDLIRRQFTGLSDANGKEMYEGDIVEYDNAVMVIEWNQEKCMFEFLQKTWNEHHYIDSKAKVIGNIYENRDLVK